MNEEMQSSATVLNLADEAGRERVNRLFRYAQVGHCVNGVAHDINNALGAAFAYAELVQMEGPLSAEQQAMLDKIMQSVEKCSKMVSAITAIARPPSDRTSMIEIKQLIRDVVLLREYALLNAQIKLRLEVDDPLPSLEANAPQLQLALLYLMLNAEEALHDAAEPKTLGLRGRRGDAALVIELWTSAPPVHESLSRDMFEPYHTTKADDHIGLGLPLARDVIQRHGGTLAYFPERGFVVELPLARE